MKGSGREPEAIKRKRQRRAPQSLEEIEKRRNVNFHDVREDKSSLFNNAKLRKKKWKKQPLFKKIIKGIALVLAIILIFIVFSVVKFFFKINTKNTIAATPVTGDSVNILLLGLDIGDVNQSDNESIKRTDTILILNYNKGTKVLQAISIPRDTLVSENGKNYKINAAFQRGGDAKVKSVVENMLSIDVNYIVKIYYEAFRNFIDAIGGVDMEIERDMIYDDDGQNLHINFKGGTTVHFDGAGAEQFFRWRKNNDGTGFAIGDLDRIENQHKFLQKVVSKCKSPGIVFKIPKILDSIAENMETNMSSWDIVSTGLKAIRADIEMKTIKGTPKMIGGQSYVVFEKNKNKELISSLASGGESSANKKTSTKILIENATKINGLANRGKTALQVFGLTNKDTGNAAGLQEKSVIYTNDNDLKRLMKSEMGDIEKIEDKPNKSEYEQYDVVIVLGKDYKKLGE